MDRPDAPDVPDDSHDAAAFWFAREHGGLMTAADRRAFDLWRQASAAHERAYQEMRQVWGVAQAVPDHKLRSIVQRRRGAAPDVSGRRYMLAGLGAVCSAAVAGAVLWPQWSRPEPTFSDRYATGRGERRQVVLPDESRLILNTATVATVVFHDSERVVVLKEGEIMFAVASDARRPFIVKTDLGQVRVTGTRFDVRRGADHLNIVVESGSVEVSVGSWWNRRTAALAPGQGISIAAADATALRVEPVNVAARTAWRQGKVVFDGAPLAEVVDEINRYRNRPIHVQGALRQLRIAGVFDVDDTDTFLAVLPTLAPVRVLPGADGGSEIVAR
ncbi:FecR family protein [Bordetella sp. BOR01]|uniref:FecR family protein n=1 Tax=Bordetella sp. BOR01 TaxID=2854779 RepID=UPI001C43AEAC|nr:FecR family protein [Bordetella sp. BOR01]MBV7486391.1 FecR family protein [Bordetella sp. BOR01]